MAVACDGSDHGIGESFERLALPGYNCTVDWARDSPLRGRCDCGSQPSLGWCQYSAALLESRDARAELVRAAALDVLAYHCSDCHLRLHSEQTLARPTTIDDLDSLVRGGHIVPLNSAASPLYRLSASGEMPPPGSVVPPLHRDELDVLALLIDSPRYWPEIAAPADCEAASFADLDSVFQSVASDLATLPGAERGFYRYLSLSNRSNALCDPAELEGDRGALLLGLNMLSLSPTLHTPLAIDEARQLYRVDLRELEWTRSIAVGGHSFRDVWEAIAAQSPYSVEFTGEAATQAQADTGTNFPLLFADHVLDQALAGELYYAILGFRPAESWYEFELRVLGLDWNLEILNGLARRAGTTRSRNTHKDRLVERHELAGRGVLWLSSDYDNGGGSSIFDDPFDYGWGQMQAIFTLPNGLSGFVALDYGTLAAESDVVFDTLQDPLPAHGAASCLACHVSGLIPIVDELKEVYITHAREIGLNAAELEQVEALYPGPSAFLELIAQDSAQFQQARNQLQLPSTGSDPVAQASLRFGAPLTLRDAAAELGVRPDVLAGNLPRWLSPLQSGTLGRNAFAAVYVASLCVLSEPLANRPDAAACERALEAAGGL